MTRQKRIAIEIPFKYVPQQRESIRVFSPHHVERRHAPWQAVRRIIATSLVH